MFRAIATIGVIQALVIAVNLIRSKVLAVQLGPEGVGVLSVVDQVVQLVSYVSAFSLPLATGKFLSRAHSEGVDAFRSTYANLLRLLVILTSIGTGISLVIVLLRPEILGAELLPYRLVLAPALIRVPVIALHGYFVHLLAAAQRWRASVLLLLLIAISLTVTTPVGIAVGGLPGLYWSNLVAEVLVVVVAFAYLRRRLDLPLFERTASIRRALRETPAIIAFGSIIYVTSIMHLTSFFTARYAVLTHHGEAEVGLLHAAITLAGSLGLVLNQAVVLYLTPLLNRDIPKEDKLRAAVDFQRNLMLLIGLLGMPIVLFAPLLLTVLFSPRFTAVGQIVFLFVVAQGLTQLAAIYQSLLVGFDDLKAYGILVASGHLSLAVVAWLLAPRFGIGGVAAGYLVSGGLLFGLTLARLVVKESLRVPSRLPFMMGYGLSAMLLAGLVCNRLDAAHPAIFGAKVLFSGLFSLSLLLFLSRVEAQRLLARGLGVLERLRGLRREPSLGRLRQRDIGVLLPAPGEQPAIDMQLD